MTTAPHFSRTLRGYLLFEAVLALAIFAGAVLTLTEALNISQETAVRLNRENAIRMGLRSFIEETRRKEIADMATEALDERLGVTYSSTVEELTLKNKDGTVLSDLYVLHAKATPGETSSVSEENVDVYLYKPQITQNTDNGDSRTGSSTNTTTGTGTGGTQSGASGATGTMSLSPSPYTGSTSPSTSTKR